MTPRCVPEVEVALPVEMVLRRLQSWRQDCHVVITNQASARLWPRLSDHPLDFNYNPSTMGGAIPLGVGLALARPDREILVLSGEGSLLMSLGCLVTVIDSGVRNLSILLLDNGMYEVTGGQKTPASQAVVDFVGMARSAGFPHATRIADLEDWTRRAPAVLSEPGPRFLWLPVGPTPPAVFAEQQPSILDRLALFRAALGSVA